jgi:hypothetical protein
MVHRGEDLPVPTMTDISVKNADVGEHTDDTVRGLLLVVRPSTRKSAGEGKKPVLRRAWVLRVSHDGQRRRIGLVTRVIQNGDRAS